MKTRVGKKKGKPIKTAEVLFVWCNWTYDTSTTIIIKKSFYFALINRFGLVLKLNC